MNEPELDGLKPCPLCGRRSTAFRMERLSGTKGLTAYAVRCYRCGAEGHVYEGYYFFRVKRQLCPLGHDKLRPEDCRHCIAMDEPADWNMERRIRLVAIDPDGGTIEILED